MIININIQTLNRTTTPQKSTETYHARSYCTVQETTVPFKKRTVQEAYHTLQEAFRTMQEANRTVHEF